MKILNWIKENKILVFIVLIGAILRFYKLDYQSMWIDEIITVNVASPTNSFLGIYNFLRDNDPHPPLYYFLIHIFFLLFGYNTLVLKFFSALIGVFGIITMYYLGKEILNKKVGLFASFLTALNFFHIYYSQEGRMYSLLFLTSCLSAYSLLIFLKKPNYKTTIIFVICSSLMIYSHFFGVFVLFSFYLILLFYSFMLKKEDSFKRLRLLVISGVLTLILYIPSIIIILSNQKRDSIWIPSPTFKTFDKMFGEFFGYSATLKALVLIVFTTSILYYFFKKKKKSLSKIEMINPVLILLVWIFVTTFLSIIYSFLSLPIVVSRYFVCVLPAIFILLALAINSFKIKSLQIGLFLTLTFFSIKTLVFGKNFYSSYYKTQFKHNIEYMVNKRPEDLIVCKLGEFYSKFYLNEYNSKQIVKEFDINTYVMSLKESKNNLENFWYFDAHLPSYLPTKETKEFLEENYILDESKEYFDSYCKHFILKKTN